MTKERGQNTEREQLIQEVGVVKGQPAAAGAARAFAQGEQREALGLGLLGCVLIVLLACVLWITAGVYASASHAQGALALRASILQAADQCYAIEGAFPLRLSYLEDRYGLSINRSSYVVTYEAFASNIAPTVVVQPL